MVDGVALREALTALTAHTQGDATPPAVRAEALALFKTAAADARARAEAMLLEDGSGEACARRLSHAFDEIVRALYDFTIHHVVRAPNLSAGERMAIAATGGYGRGTLAPGSDLDLLFVLPWKQTATGESIVEAMLYMLWDMGLKVGHATRTVPECIRLSRDDMTIRTAVLEARFLHGEEALLDELMARFDREIVAAGSREFIVAKLAERDLRHEKGGRSRYMVEPNVKDGKGGQRDLHTLFWIAKYHYRVRSIEELREAGVLDGEELARFRKAQDFLWAVRCHMHFATGRAEERLTFDLQPELARRLGYTDHPGQSAVERFMKHYFLTAKDVGDLTRILCAELEEAGAKGAGRIAGVIARITTRTKAVPGTDAFRVGNGRLRHVHDDVFERDPVDLIRLFAIAEERGLMFHPDTLHLATKSLRRIDASVRKDRNANAAFLAVLTSRRTPDRTLRVMNECGVLGRFLPDFGRIVAMMQFNMYHHFTVDEHLIRSVAALSDMEHGRVDDDHPLAAPLARELLADHWARAVLFVALLLHDIAKGRPEDHSVAGARIARRLCPRLGLDARQTEAVAWLIEEHLTMSTVAQSRDLSDPRTVSDFAEKVRKAEWLRMLLVLTACDIRAVGPGVWNGWKGQLLRTLYAETEPVVTGGFTAQPRAARVAAVRAELDERLADLDAALRERILGLPYDAWYLSLPRDRQEAVLRFLAECDIRGEKLATLVRLRDPAPVTQITLLAPDHPRLLSTIAGCVSAADGDILDAHISTTRDGRALDTIEFRRAFDDDGEEIARAERIAASIRAVLSGDKRLGTLPVPQPAARTRAFSVPIRVRVDDTASDRFTVIEVEGLDWPGVLSRITDALADASLDIASAHVATFGEKFIDTFYVTDLTGQKIASPQKRAAIRRRLETVLGEGPRRPARAA